MLNKTDNKKKIFFNAYVDIKNTSPFHCQNFASANHFLFLTSQSSTLTLHFLFPCYLLLFFDLYKEARTVLKNISMLTYHMKLLHCSCTDFSMTN